MAYIGIGNIAKKIKNCYIGVDGIAKKVSKAYIGINGIARLWWSTAVECPLVYSGRVGDMSQGRCDYCGVASNDNFIFYCGGGPKTSSSYINNSVDRYNISGTRTVCSTYPMVVKNNMGISGDKYAVFAAGANSSSGTTYVRAYNTSGTQSSPSNLSYARMSSNNMEIFAHNRYYVLGGGISIKGTNLEGSSVRSSTIVEQAEYYSSSLAKTVVSTTFLKDITGSANCFSNAPFTGTTADKNYIIVGGGKIWDRQTLGDITSSANYNVYAYNSGWSRTTLTSFPSEINPGYLLAHSLSNGLYLVDTAYDDDWRYDNNLVQSRLTNPFWITYDVDPVTVDDYIVGFGDYGETIKYVFTVIDKNGIITYCDTLPTNPYVEEGDYMTLGALKNRLFVSGGRESSKVASTIVEVYDIIT